GGEDVARGRRPGRVVRGRDADRGAGGRGPVRGQARVRDRAFAHDARSQGRAARHQGLMGLRTWILRRFMGRLRIDDDTISYLSTFQRLGETVEVQLPGELLPVGARTVFRALRTRAAAQLGPDWIWPFWLERQLDPRSSAFVPRGHLPTLANLTNRTLTIVGNGCS